MGFHRAFHEWSMCMKITSCENERSSSRRKPTPLKKTDFWPGLAPYEMMIPGAKNGDPACPFIGTLGRGHSTRTCFLVVKREFWFYRAAMCSHEGRSCRVRDFFEFTWHSFTWIKNHFMANNCDNEGWWTVSFHFSNFIRCLLFNTIT